MADPELKQVRSPEALTVTVVRARNLRGVRGDTVNASVKVEFGEKGLGESPKVDCTPEEPAEFNYQSSFNVTFEDPLTLDEIACKPVIMTVIEILPKEKKQKEEKTQILGQASLDLLPIVQGHHHYKYTLVVHSVPGSPLEQVTPDMPRPELDVTISVDEPLLSESQIKESNLLCITTESLYSPPDSWTLSGGQHIYTAALPMPVTNEKDNTVVFAGGQLKPGLDKEPAVKEKKWAIPGFAQGNAIYIPEKLIPADTIDDEDGDFKGKDDREHRLMAETDKNRVTWNIERRCYMDATGTKSFQEKIAKTRYWPIEVYRTGIPAAAKAGKKDDESHIGFHGVAYINLAPLLYPGVKRVRGAYKVVAYSEQELTEKTNRKGGLAEEALKIATGILSRSSSSPFPKPSKGGKEDVKVKEAKKGRKTPSVACTAHVNPVNPVGLHSASDGASEADAAPVVNVEGQQYTEAHSYVMVEIVLLRPLVPKRPPEELAHRVAEYIPPREVFPKRREGAEQAVSEFASEIGKLAKLILTDVIRKQFGITKEDEVEENRQKLIHHLNVSGMNHAFQEQLKYSVQKIVREKFNAPGKNADPAEKRAFYDQLYVYLIDEMHAGVSKVLSVQDQPPVPAPLTDSQQLKHFAREAELNQNTTLARDYYLERISRDEKDPDHWLDYGTFCLSLNDLTRAEECFKQCVSLDQRHLHGLLLYAVVCTMDDKRAIAETFFEAATAMHPESLLAWTMRGLFYESAKETIGAEMALHEADKLNQQAAVAEYKAAREEEAAAAAAAAAAESKTHDELAHPGSAGLQDNTHGDGEENHADNTHASKEGTPADNSGLKPTAATPTSQAGSENKIGRSGSKDRRNSAMRKSAVGSRMKSQENISRPGSQLRSPGVVGVGGVEGEGEEAPPRDPTPVPAQTPFMQAMDFLLETKAMMFTDLALFKHLDASMGGPSSEYYIALAQLRLQRRELREAEDALNEALGYDHQNPDVWGIMGHVKYLMGHVENAKDCYERTLSFVTNASEMHSIYLRLASIYLQEGMFMKAKNQFLMACKKSPSCVTWLGVGIACYRLEELLEAEDALAEANSLNNHDPEVWAYLSLVCLKTGRQLEAEQAYKYAIKLKLGDQELYDELQRVQQEVGFGNSQMSTCRSATGNRASADLVSA